MKHELRAVLACVLLAAAASAQAEEPSKPAGAAKKPTSNVAQIVNGGNDFALAMYHELAARSKGNLFFSPNSIHTALAMTYAGGRGNTAAQMEKTLRLPRQNPHPAYRSLLAHLRPGKQAGYKLHVANALWGQKGYPWLKDFLATTKDNYGAGLREVDFIRATEQARKTINVWVEKQTNDKIKDLLKPGILDELTRLVLTNAIYFKGDWASQFDKKATREVPFKLSAEKTAKAAMMYQKAKFAYAEDKAAQVLSMPYKGKDLSMLVLLPRKVDGLAALAKNLTARDVAAWVGKLRRREVRVYLPKFKMTSQFRLKEALTAMGMGDAFKSGVADFSGMDGRKVLFISAVVHKAFVDVNEEGTEAAAATAVIMAAEAVAPRPLIFRADHPFLFAIRHDKTGAILFLGRVSNPGK